MLATVGKAGRIIFDKLQNWHFGALSHYTFRTVPGQLHHQAKTRETVITKILNKKTSIVPLTINRKLLHLSIGKQPLQMECSIQWGSGGQRKLNILCKLLKCVRITQQGSSQGTAFTTYHTLGGPHTHASGAENQPSWSDPEHLALWQSL